MNTHETDPQNSEDSRNQFLDTILRVADTPDGAVVIDWLFSSTGVRKPAHTIGGSVHDTLYRDGRRSIGLEIQETLAAARANRPGHQPAATGRATSTRASAGRKKP